METSKKKKLIIAIDGPSGAGKSTVGRVLASQLEYLYIDTGAMYRALALKLVEKGILPEDDLLLYQFALSLSITFVRKEEETHILCNGEDITDAIRSPKISRMASDISKRRGVREALVRMQREMGRAGGIVMEGRDIGTVVFPDADVKFYLDAGLEERARRRFQELIEKGVEVNFEKTFEEVTERDHQDMNRTLSPLKKAEDAILINSTRRSIKEVVEEMVRIVMGRSEIANRDET